MGFLFFKKRPSGRINFHIPYQFDRQIKEEVSYKESYFDDNSEFNKDLAKLSLAFALSSFSSNLNKDDLAKSADNAVDFLKDLGFQGVWPNHDYALPPTPKSLAVIFGHKKIKGKDGKKTLIAIGIRGGNYGAEWASNVTTGSSGPHEGFSLSKEKLFHDLFAYLDAAKIKGRIAVWVVGYSRAAGVANMFAADLSEDSLKDEKLVKKIKIRPNAIFAYCFASPATAERKKRDFAGIYNIMNPNDMIPLVPPRAFGFGHYGKVIFLQDSGLPEVKEKINENFKHLDIPPIDKTFRPMKLDILHIKDKQRRTLPDDRAEYLAPRDFLLKALDIVGSHITREEYAEHIQEGLASLLVLVNPEMDDPYGKIKEVFAGFFASLFEEKMGISFLAKLFSNRRDISEMIEPHLQKAFDEAGLEGIDVHLVVHAFSHLVRDLLPALQRNPGMVATTINKDNASLFLLAHQPHMYWALLNLD